MAETTRNLGLPLIAAAQAQKHVTHNEALTALDALVQLACLDKDLTAPPADPAEGDRYLVAAANPTGAWAGLSGQVVRLLDGVWVGSPPRPGWLAYLVDEADLYTFTGSAWIGYRDSLTAFRNLARLGIGTTADATNRLSVKSEAALFSWDDATPGSGSLRLTLNKQSAAKDACLAIQTGFSTRALLGTFASDDVSLKVSADGASFVTAASFTSAGKATFGAGIEGTGIGAVTAAAGRFTGLTATGSVAFQQGGVVGGTAVSTRSASFDTYGRITWRYDDSGVVQGPVLNNYGVTGIGQGAAVLSVNLGSGGALVAAAGTIGLSTTAAFASTATASAKWQFKAATAGGLGIGLEVGGNYAATPLLSLAPQASDPAGGGLGQVYANSTATALKWHNGSAWGRINNFAKFSASTNFDNYIAAGTWTKVQFNAADSNDQGAFVAAGNRCSAPEAGLYAFSVALVFKKNGASAPSAFEVQLYRNGVAAGRGRAAATGTLVDGVTAIDLSSTLKLAASDTVEVFARFTGADGYVAASDSFFGAQQMA